MIAATSSLPFRNMLDNTQKLQFCLGSPFWMPPLFVVLCFGFVPRMIEFVGAHRPSLKPNPEFRSFIGTKTNLRCLISC
jgi:hypothetical protein